MGRRKRKRQEEIGSTAVRLPVLTEGEARIQVNFTYGVFVVTVEGAGKKLSSQGGFGKAQHSRSLPEYAERKLANIEVMRAAAAGCNDHARVEALDKDAENVRNFTEPHILMPVEVYYLLSEVGSVEVCSDSKVLLPGEVWDLCCKATIGRDFAVDYAAYRHYRNRGWIVRNGSKFSADYVLYRDTVGLVHSEYSVVVFDARAGTSPYPSQSPAKKFSFLQTSSRVNANSVKTFVCAYVTTLPNQRTSGGARSTMDGLGVMEVAFGRWFSEKHEMVKEGCAAAKKVIKDTKVKQALNNAGSQQGPKDADAPDE